MVACPTCGGYVPPSDGGGGFPVRNAMLDDAMKGGAVGGAEGRRDADVLRAMVRRAAEGDVASISTGEYKVMADTLMAKARAMAKHERAGGAAALAAVLRESHTRHTAARDVVAAQLAAVDADIRAVESKLRNSDGRDADAAARAMRHVDDLAEAYLGAVVPDVSAVGDDAAAAASAADPPASPPKDKLGVIRRSVAALASKSCLRLVADVSAAHAQGAAQTSANANASTRSASNARIIASLEFDYAGEYFAAAGVARCIRLFRYDDVVADATDTSAAKRPRLDAEAPAAPMARDPVLSIDVKHKLSCLSWCRLAAPDAPLASTDYEGVVSLYDPSTGRLIRDTCEHERRLWSVAFADQARPQSFATGGDDGRVKLWNVNDPCSVLTLELRANVCAVEFQRNNPDMLAVGSADHYARIFDLRMAQSNRPLLELCGHTRAVSYVRWLQNPAALVSASIDGALKVWEGVGGSSDSLRCVRSLEGHVNERNFVGLAAGAGDAEGFLVCGSETNQVFAYHRSSSKPIAHHAFGDDAGVHVGTRERPDYRFVSAVVWRPGTSTLLAANSRGLTRVLELS